MHNLNKKNFQNNQKPKFKLGEIVKYEQCLTFGPPLSLGIIVNIEYNVEAERFEYNVQWIKQSDNDFVNRFSRDGKKVFFRESTLIKVELPKEQK